MKKSNKIKIIKVILVIAFIALFALYSYISYRANYLQVLEIGEEYLNVFYQKNEYKAKVFILSFIILILTTYITNILIKKGLKPFFDDENKQMPKLPNKSIAFIISIIGSSILTSIFLEKTMLFVYNTWFGINDPIFGIDIGFFFFQKPFIELVLRYVTMIFIGLAIYTAAYYIIVFNICLEGVDKQLLLKSKFIKTLKIDAILIIISIACTTFLDTYNMVFNEFISLKDNLSTKLIGAGISDVTIRLWGYRILGIVMIISVVLILKYILNKKKIKKLLVSICIVPGYLVSLFMIILVFNLMFVNSNKLDKEKQYISYNIDYTKAAYNLDIEETEIENSDGISKVDIEENRDIINNIRLVDDSTTLKTLNSLQTNSGYYTYRTTKLQKYKINGQDTLVYVSPREIDASTDTTTYDNKTYEYTHGFSTIVTYANKVDSAGNVEYVQKGFNLSNNDIYIEEPRIYFGLETDSAIITNSNNKSEFDYPINSTTSVEYQYKGEAGIKLGFLDRLILSIMNRDVNITFSNTNVDSKIILNRNVIERVKTIIPELIYDKNPYLIISDEGRQIWVIDAYTVSNYYPYSQKILIETEFGRKEINYIRNSVKVLIDAYDGTVDFYIMDKTDPIAVAYQNMYLGVFKDGASIPTSISSHFVYPEYLYNVQSELLKVYHNVSEDILYRGDDIWDDVSFSSSLKTKSNTKIEPYYTMIKDNEENKVGLVLPYTVEGKQNITSYLVGTVDLNGSLNLKLYRYVSGSNVLGPSQLDKEIEQDETISQEIQSINVTGTKITKNIIIVPIDNSLIYIEPIYQQQLNEKNAIPLLKKVVVASGNKVAIGDNFDEALQNLVSQSAVNIKVENTDTLEDLINTIIEANKNLKDSTASQDFEMIGKDITKLQNLINQLEEQKAADKEAKEDKTEQKLGNKVLVNEME